MRSPSVLECSGTCLLQARQPDTCKHLYLDFAVPWQVTPWHVLYFFRAENVGCINYMYLLRYAVYNISEPMHGLSVEPDISPAIDWTISL